MPAAHYVPTDIQQSTRGDRAGVKTTAKARAKAKGRAKARAVQRRPLEACEAWSAEAGP